MNLAIENLISESSTIVKNYNKDSIESGENFNLFSILRIENDEVRTHSRFLAALLNPKGAHGRGSLFLSLFLERFAADFGLDIKSAEVRVEFNIGKVIGDEGGRLDILIRDKDQKVIMIENKIYAPEGTIQLPRYLKKYPNGRLFFLTLFGNESVEKALIGKYLAISYSDDLISWLEDCQNESINAPILHQNIRQYADLIRKLTNQNKNKQMSKDILVRAYRDEDSFKAYTAIVNTRNEVLVDTFRNIVFPILENIATELNLELNIDRESFKNHGKRYVGFRFSGKSNSKGFPNITFQFQGPNYTNLQFGLTKTSPDDQLLETSQDVLEKFEASFGHSQQSKHWFAYTDYSEYFNWNDLNTLGEIRFGNFQTDLRRKVGYMLDIIETKWNKA